MRKILSRDFCVIATTLISSSLLLCTVTVAADKHSAKTENSDAVKSLERVLQKAGEQGFVKIDGESLPAQSGKVNQNKSNNNTSRNVPGEGVDCSTVGVLNVAGYQTVVSYDAISKAASGLKKNSTIQEALPLIRTYMALGFGSEMSSYVRGTKSPEARLIEAVGHAIEGRSSENDFRTIAQYSHCNSSMKLWSAFARTSQTFSPKHDGILSVDRNDQEYLEQLPPNLQRIVQLRLGIFAAEQKADALAVRFLSSLAPETKYGDLPVSKDDAILYYVALVRQMKGDPTSQQIFQHLAQYDGIYRTRSLQKLAEENFHSGGKLYDNFSDDLASVSQQYSGQVESRKASLQVVKQSTLGNRFIEAIEISKREFTLLDAEFTEAMNFVAEHVIANLNDKVKTQQLHGLNAYLHDPSYFSKFDNVEALNARAKSVAIELNLPELVAVVASESKISSQDSEKFLTYADALIAQKNGEYLRVLQLAKPHKADPKFQALILAATLNSGNYKKSTEALSLKPLGAERFTMQSDIAWQQGKWVDAKFALEALAHNTPDAAVTKKIAIANYIGVEGQAYVSRTTPNTAADLDLLTNQLDSDIALVKGYLSNG